MTAVTEAVVITEPGVHDEMPEGVYHADPVPGGSLSNSGAKLLMPPGCPALYRWMTDHPEDRKRTAEMELGVVAHHLVLGHGPQPILTSKDRWDTNDVKAEVAAIRAAGNVPIKAAGMRQVQAMAVQLRRHSLAAALLDPEMGPAETSLFWIDDEYDVMRRSRIDKLHYGTRTTVVDYKSCASAHPDACSKAMYNFGYYRQGPYYVDGVQALGLGDDTTAFLLVFQEVTPPYLVTVAGPDETALAAGREVNRRALERYADCQASGIWPGYAEDIVSLPLPPWAERRFLEETYA